nr:hypothetical protein [Tanacetum cinerariifolium]
MQSMKDNEVWVLVELHPNGKTVDSKWLFMKKTDMDGNVHIYKARLVAKGYTQTPGIDYEETFSPVADIRAIRILIAIAAYYDYEIWQINFKTAFLNGYPNEEVYMKQPEGFVNPKYPNRASGSNITFLILYVDDILIMGNIIPMLQSVKTYLGKCFAMKDLECDGFVQNYNMHSMRKTVNELHAMLKLHEQTLNLPKSSSPALHAIQAGKVQKSNKHKKSHSQKGAKGKNQGKGKFAPKPKGLRASRKLKPRALSLYVGNGQREAVEAIGAFYLCLP